jgi:DNA gyrase/topoisomerase IV subunit A
MNLAHMGAILAGHCAPRSLSSIATVQKDGLTVPTHAFARLVARSYAKEVAHNRALPDVLDGLLPVHRRLIYTCYLGRFFPVNPPRKSAKIVGNVLGDFHPHGDSSVLDAIDTLVTMPQPIMDGTISSFKSLFVEEVESAAMRYTETRLTVYGQSFVNPDYLAVSPFVDNYDATQREPHQLPSVLPNILLNRIDGIGFGISARIPPFTPKSVLALLVRWLTQGPQDAAACAQTLKLAHSQNPEILDGPDVLQSVFEKGYGVIKAGPRLVLDSKAGCVRIVGMPPRFKYSKLAALFDKAKIVFAEMQDHSTRDGYDIHVRYKRGTDPKAFADSLKKALTATIPMRWVVADRVSETRIDVLETPLPALVGLWLDKRLALEKKYWQHLLATTQGEIDRNNYDAYLYRNRVVILKALLQDDARAALQSALNIDAKAANEILQQPSRKFTRFGHDAWHQKDVQLRGKLQQCRDNLADVRGATLRALRRDFQACLGIEQ